MGNLENRERNLLKYFFSLILCGVCAFVITYLMVTFVVQRIQVEGKSMETNLSDNDNLIVEKISYMFDSPKRFDIIVFPYKHEKDNDFIKRIIALPGEVVQIDDKGRIYINGEILNESYGREVIMEAGDAKNPIKIGEGEYFVLGDNRNNSLDSRFPEVGLIKEKDILGRAFLKIYPFKEFEFIKH